LPIADRQSPIANRQSPIANRQSPIAEYANRDSRIAIREGQSAIGGRAYLLARLEEERRVQAGRRQAETLAAELHAPLSRLATESTQQVLLTPRLLLTAAYLIERTRIEIFRAGVERLSAANPALHFLCTGPWPPYNFVTTTVARAGVPEGGETYASF
jgi:hypothetical protein